LRAFIDRKVRFMIVGAYALGVHGRPRATADLDVWVDATPGNALNIMRALAEFGAPTGHVPPLRIDVLTELSGLTFDEAWPSRTQASFGPVTVDVLGREAFIKNKRATGRARDLGDIEALGE